MTDKIQVLDLFSGTGSFSRAFEESDRYEVTSVDVRAVEFNGENFEPDIKKDVLDLEPDDLPDADIVLASPPCTKFSVASIGHHWETIDNQDTYMPKKKECMIALEFVHHSIYLIRQLNPDYWFMENPRAMLRKLLWMPQGTITWCQYWTDRDQRERGSPVMKPTDLWGNHPDTFDYKSCKNGADCHESASRGSSSGTQGKESADVRGAIPYGISKAVKSAIEEEGL